MTTDRRPTVLFVCVSNAGKSQMAEALLRRRVGDAVAIHSAGTRPKPVEAGVNAESAASVAEVGASMADATPKGIDPELLRTADRVVILGADAQVEPVEGMKATIERWETDEPSLRGIEGSLPLCTVIGLYNEHEVVGGGGLAGRVEEPCIGQNAAVGRRAHHQRGINHARQVEHLLGNFK